MTSPAVAQILRLPDSIVHADWSVGRAGRWSATARLVGADTYRAEAPRPVGVPAELLEHRHGAARLLGLDFPIGVPAAYAAAAGITAFVPWLLALGRRPWHDVHRPAATADELSVHRPFYPARPDGARRALLAAGLGVGHHDDLLRVCERPGALVRRPSALFWLVGANQVGRAALSGWSELLVPALRRRGGRPSVRLWPFDGHLRDLLTEAGTVVAETYPAQCAAAIGVWPVVKSRADSRRAAGPAVREAATRLGVELSGAAGDAVDRGFPGDDAFDAFVGMLGLVEAIRNGCDVEPPVSRPACRTVEGWIVGAVDPTVQRDAARTPPSSSYTARGR